MATILPQPPGTIVYTAATAGGDTVALGTANRAVILVRNASAAPVVVTRAGVVPCSQGFNHVSATTSAIGDTEIVPLPHTIDSGPTVTHGNILLTYSASASVSVAATMAT